MNAISEKLAFQTAATQSRPGAPSRGPGPHLVRLALVLVLILGAALVINWWLVEAQYIESTDNAYVQGDIVVLGPRIEGDITAIPVADNQHVKVGQPLILLDPRDATARLAQARGAQAEAAAAAMTARRQVTQSRSAIAQAGAMLAQAHADAVQTQADAARSGQLVRGGWTSRQANELAATQAAKAQSAVAAAEAAEAAARQAEAVAEAQVMQADAKLESATAAVTLASNSLADTVIRAPIDGIVGNRAAQLGQHVQPGQQLISVTPDAAQLYVVANFKETQLARMHAGQPVDLIADIDSGKVIHGRVDSLAPATGALFSLLPPENATGNFTKVVQRVPVKVVLDPGEAARAKWLRAGLSVTSEVDTRAKPEPRLGIWGDAMATLRRK